MPRVNLPYNTILRTGIAGFFGNEVTGDPANNHDVVPSTGLFVGIRNSGAGAHNVTLLAGRVVDGTSPSNVVLNVGSNTTYFIGPFPVGAFVQSDGRIWINVDHAEVLLKAFLLPPTS